MQIRLADFGVMTESEQLSTLDRLLNGPQEEVSAVDAGIRRYELRYEMSSDEMRRKVAAGEIRETAEVADWLFLLRARPDRVAR
jgi:hypothetical protein